MVTDHARERMRERSIDEATLLKVIETGEIRRSDAQHLFIFKPIESRHDNLACAAAVEEDHLVVKTVMTNWRLLEQS
ncbi:MAG: DUF4258 domain-containing protein [Betaproteobacteria bacterium]